MSIESVLGFAQEVAPRDQESFYKIVKEVFGDKKLSDITELEPSDIRILLRLWAIHCWADKQVDMIPEVIRYYMRLQISKKRKGANERIEMLKPAQMFMQPQQQQPMGPVQR